MKRWAVIGVQIAAAVLVGLAIRELWVAARGEGDAVGTPARAVSVTSTIEPDVVAFGTPVVATADVVADTTVVDPGSIRLQVDFTPYEVAGEPSTERHVEGGTTHVVFRYTLRCLREGCEPAGARGVAQFEPGLVRYRFRGSPGAGRDVVEWPQVIVASRVAAADVEAIRWRASRTDLPALTTRFGPKGLAAVLLVGALAARRGRRLARPSPLARASRARGRDAAGRAVRRSSARSSSRSPRAATVPPLRTGGERSSAWRGSSTLSGWTTWRTRPVSSRGRPVRRAPRRSRAWRGAHRTRRRTAWRRPYERALASSAYRPADVRGRRAARRAPADALGAPRARGLRARAVAGRVRPRPRPARPADELLRDRERRHRRARPVDERRRREVTARVPRPSVARGDGGARWVGRLLRQRLRDAPARHAERGAPPDAPLLRAGACRLPRAGRVRRPSWRQPRRRGAAPARGEPLVARVPGRDAHLDRARRGPLGDRPRGEQVDVGAPAERPRRLRASTRPRSPRS